MYGIPITVILVVDCILLADLEYVIILVTNPILGCKCFHIVRDFTESQSKPPGTFEDVCS